MTPTSWALARRQLARQIGARSHEGRDLVDFLAVVARGEPVPSPDGPSERPTPALQRQAAALLERWDRHVLLKRLELLDLAHINLVHAAADVDPVA